MVEILGRRAGTVNPDISGEWPNKYDADNNLITDPLSPKIVISSDNLFNTTDPGPILAMPRTQGEPAGTVTFSDRALAEMKKHGLTTLYRHDQGEGGWDLSATTGSTDYPKETKWAGEGEKVRSSDGTVYPNEAAYDLSQGRLYYITDSTINYVQLGENGPIVSMEDITWGMKLRIDDPKQLAILDTRRAENQPPQYAPDETATLKTDYSRYAEAHTNRAKLKSKKNLVVAAGQQALYVDVRRPDAVIDIQANIDELKLDGPGGATVRNLGPIVHYDTQLGQQTTSPIILNNKGRNDLHMDVIGLGNTLEGSNEDTHLILPTKASLIYANTHPSTSTLRLYREGGHIRIDLGNPSDDGSWGHFTAPEAMVKSLTIGDTGKPLTIDTSRLTSTPLEIDLEKAILDPSSVKLPEKRADITFPTGVTLAEAGSLNQLPNLTAAGIAKA